jgi:uncharacterized SAM-binding protein YcdF (DUF218 family)
MNVVPDLSYIVRALVLPPQGLFFMLGVGLVLCRWRPRIGRRLAAAAVILLLLLSTPVVSRLFVYPLEFSMPALASSHYADAQAIVVLAAGRLVNAPEYDHRDVPDHIALPRLRYAARLHHETGLPVLVSGGGTGEPLSFGMARALEDDFKVPVRWIESRSANTAENAEFSARILRREGVKRVLLVTDAMHMPRAVMAFSHSGLEVVPAPTVFFSSGGLRPLHFIPSAEGLRRSHYAMYEWMGLIWYRLQYRGNQRPQQEDG